MSACSRAHERCRSRALRAMWTLAEEEMELRRLEAGVSPDMGGGFPRFSGAASRGCGQEAAAECATLTGIHGQANSQADARQTLVTGYAEHRASLSEKKRKKQKADMKDYSSTYH